MMLETLQEAILRDMMPASSSQCVSSIGTTSSTFEFEKATTTSSQSSWYDGGQYGPYANLESEVFLAQMRSHTKHDDDNRNHTWTLRVGKGGNIYSFVGPMGETVAPQKRNDSPWVDEVWQTVSVDLDLHSSESNSHDSGNSKNGGPYFVHQAGTYQRDTNATGYNETMGVPLTALPFFSPSLGKYCNEEEGECGFVSWGQQAHVPTSFSSGVLYFNRYKDCGNGVLEYTMLVHNNVGNTDTLNHLNVPWGGVRSSTLQSVVLSDKHNRFANYENRVEPIPDWSQASILDIDETLGYTIFAQDLPSSNNGKPYPLPTGLSLQVGPNGCAENAVHTNIWGRLTIRCHLVPTIDLGSEGAINQAIRMVVRDFGGGGGGEVIADGVVHWAYEGEWLYFWPTLASPTKDVASALFCPGSQLDVQYFNPGTAIADNLALGHVFGANDDDRRKSWKTRLRLGSTRRDYTAYTIISNPQIQAGDTYYYRQYFIMDRYEDIAGTAFKFAKEAEQDRYKATEGPPGRSILLVTDGKSSNNKVGAIIGGSELYQGNCTKVCIGSTTPKPHCQALFQIKCGGAGHVAITTDQYYLGPSAANPRRPYVCDGMATERPEWTLLGFFHANDCLPISSSFQFDPTHCAV